RTRLWPSFCRSLSPRVPPWGCRRCPRARSSRWKPSSPSEIVSVAATGTSLTERKLHKLGLLTPQDFLLHLPLRYEDETRVTPVARLRPGIWAQVEGEVLRCEVQLRPRRQLVATIADDSGELGLRYLNFYPSQQQQLTAGRRVRVKGEP